MRSLLAMMILFCAGNAFAQNVVYTGNVVNIPVVQQISVPLTTFVPVTTIQQVYVVQPVVVQSVGYPVVYGGNWPIVYSSDPFFYRRASYEHRCRWFNY